VIEVLKSILVRDMLKLKDEIKSYKNEQTLWMIDAGISNSAGNLCLHLIGNINHFIGSTLGNTGYVRNRDLEFSQKNIPVEVLAAQIDDTVGSVENTFDRLSNDTLNKDFPLLYHDEKVTTFFMLTHIVSHFDYHLGQINYHRRLLDK
jgi:hypothetical protein